MKKRPLDGPGVHVASYPADSTVCRVRESPVLALSRRAVPREIAVAVPALVLRSPCGAVVVAAARECRECSMVAARMTFATRISTGRTVVHGARVTMTGCPRLRSPQHRGNRPTCGRNERPRANADTMRRITRNPRKLRRSYFERVSSRSSQCVIQQAPLPRRTELSVARWCRIGPLAAPETILRAV